MSQNSNDLRVRRTQKLLQDAMIALIEERGFETLTVGEIALRAMVSRAAFYRYYQDKYDLVEKIFEETMAAMRQDITPGYEELLNNFVMGSSKDSWDILFGETTNSQLIPGPWVRFFEHVEKHERLYRALLGKKGSAWFVNKWRASLAEDMGQYLQKVALSVNKKSIALSHLFTGGLVPTLLAAQLIDTIVWWLENNRSYSPRSIATYYYRLRTSFLREVGVLAQEIGEIEK